MGTVLAMTARGRARPDGRGMRPVAAGATLAALLALAGCGGAGEGDAAVGAGDEEAVAAGGALGLAGRAEALAGGLLGGGEPGPRRARPDFRPEAIAADPGAYRLVRINALGVAEAARVIQANGPDETIELQSGPTAAFQAGILASTHGFGFDLIAIDTRPVLAALRAGGGAFERRMDTLDGQDQVATSTFACTVTPAGAEEVDLGIRRATLSRFDENCRSAALVFDNIYWLDGDGRVASSRQFVSPTVAYLRSNRL